MIAYAGIDPGLTGCVCVLPPEGRPRFFDMPVIETVVSGKKRHVPDEAEMVNVLQKLLASIQYGATSLHVTLEKVNAMPASGPGGRNVRIGATSMFNFGFGYGLWCMALTALKIPHDRVHPATWKARLLRDTNRDDGAAAQVAGRLYPEADPLLRGPKGGLKMGRVDALLIAHYGKIAAVSAG